MKVPQNAKFSWSFFFSWKLKENKDSKFDSNIQRQFFTLWIWHDPHIYIRLFWILPLEWLKVQILLIFDPPSKELISGWFFSPLQNLEESAKGIDQIEILAFSRLSSNQHISLNLSYFLTFIHFTIRNENDYQNSKFLLLEE
jgi:hypothetical protein